MSARLVKADRGRAAPAGVINEKLNKLLVAKVDSAGIVPSEADGNELDRLYVALAAVSAEEHPRTARLLASSTRKVAQKVIEEAGEVALATVKHNKNGIVRESADLLYHLAVLWRRAGITSDEIWAEMRRRADNLGIAEKLLKS